jgi:hypothetical protein
MTRARLVVAASLIGACFAAGVVLAQSQPAPTLAPVLGGKKFTPPFKGQADVDFTKPVTKRDKSMVVTTMQVKNNTNAPLLRLTIDETWYDKGGTVVAGGQGIVSRLEPGEIAAVKIETPFNDKMSANNYNFRHANGTVKPHRVEKLAAANDAKEPAAKTAASKKK